MKGGSDAEGAGGAGMAPGTGGAGDGGGARGAEMAPVLEGGMAAVNGAGMNGDYGDCTEMFGWFDFPKVPGEVVAGSNGVVGAWDPVPGTAEMGDWLSQV